MYRTAVYMQFALVRADRLRGNPGQRAKAGITIISNVRYWLHRYLPPRTDNPLLLVPYTWRNSWTKAATLPCHYW